MTTLPTIDVWSKVHVYLYYNPDVPVKVSHLYDFAHIAVALPYCDVLVLDKEMTHTLQANKLHERYSAAVYSKLEDAVLFLERHSP